MTTGAEMFASVGEDLFRAVLQGAPPGTVYALVALGFVLAYKTSGVFNLAFGAQAYVSAVVYFKAHTEWGWGNLPAFIVSVVILAPLLGFALEWLIFRHLRTAARVADAGRRHRPDRRAAGDRRPRHRLRAEDGPATRGHRRPTATTSSTTRSACTRSAATSWSAMVVALRGDASALAALFKFTTVGLRMRAVVESPRMTELNGIAADRVSAFAWALSSFFAGLAGVLIAPRFNTLAADEFFNIVVVAIAAAAVGHLVSLPRALAGGLGLGILIALFNTFLPRWSDDFTWLAPIQKNLTPAIPFLVLFGVLVFSPKSGDAARRATRSPGVDPPPASQARGRRSEAGRHPPAASARRSSSCAASSCSRRGDAVWIFLVTQAVVLAIVFLSITVITGFGGHISLAQGAFAAIGGFTVFQLADRFDMPVLVAALIGGAASRRSSVRCSRCR